MDLTESWRTVLPVDILARYDIRETRMASAIIASTSPTELAEIVATLRAFSLRTSDLTAAGGNESNLAHRLNYALRWSGWREARVDTRVALDLVIMPFSGAMETESVVRTTEAESAGYKVDCFKGRLALDVEWNAKDGNLDRDIGAYRTLYDAGLIDCGIMITRTQDDLRRLAYQLAREAGASVLEARKRLNTTTTTNYNKLMPRVLRGALGGCPFLAVFICARTWEGHTDESGLPGDG